MKPTDATQTNKVSSELRQKYLDKLSATMPPTQARIVLSRLAIAVVRTLISKPLQDNFASIIGTRRRAAWKLPEQIAGLEKAWCKDIQKHHPTLDLGLPPDEIPQTDEDIERKVPAEQVGQQVEAIVVFVAYGMFLFCA